MSNQLITNAVELMFAGMGVVFLFLLVLTTVTYILGRIAPSKEPAQRETATSTNTSDHSSIVAAIAVAVKQYRKDKGSQK